MFHKKKVVEKIKTHFMFSNPSPPQPENAVQPDRPQMTIERGPCALHAG